MQPPGDQPNQPQPGQGQFPTGDLPQAPPVYPMPPEHGHYPQHPPQYAYPYPHAYPHPYSAKTNGFAVASLVLGILGFFVITGILALIFGYIAREQIRERGESGNGMAIAGIVLGWVWVGLVLLRILVLVAVMA